LTGNSPSVLVSRHQRSPTWPSRPQPRTHAALARRVAGNGKSKRNARTPLSRTRGRGGNERKRLVWLRSQRTRHQTSTLPLPRSLPLNLPPPLAPSPGRHWAAKCKCSASASREVSIRLLSSIDSLSLPRCPAISRSLAATCRRCLVAWGWLCRSLVVTFRVVRQSSLMSKCHLPI
jgi:hypothetical protein